MRKTVLLLIVVLFAATSVFAGGKGCDMKHARKNVELTGTFQRVAEEDGEKVYFRLADGEKYSVCHKSKAAALKVAEEATATVRVKGHLVSCGDGQELMIEHAKKI